MFRNVHKGLHRLRTPKATSQIRLALEQASVSWKRQTMDETGEHRSSAIESQPEQAIRFYATSDLILSKAFRHSLPFAVVL